MNRDRPRQQARAVPASTSGRGGLRRCNRRGRPTCTEAVLQLERERVEGRLGVNVQRVTVDPERLVFEARVQRRGDVEAEAEADDDPDAVVAVVTVHDVARVRIRQRLLGVAAPEAGAQSTVSLPALQERQDADHREFRCRGFEVDLVLR